MQVRSVYADRGFGTSTADAELNRHRIRDPIIPRPQRAAPVEHNRNWKRRYRYRNASKAASQLKRKGLPPHPPTKPQGAQPGSAASPSPTTCNESRSSPDQHG
jgi:hypothetical protein